MRGADCACGVAVQEVAGKGRREIGQALLELADEDGMQVLAPGGMPDALDLGDEIRIEPQSRHFRSTVNMPRRQSDANREPCPCSQGIVHNRVKDCSAHRSSDQSLQ